MSNRITTILASAAAAAAVTGGIAVADGSYEASGDASAVAPAPAVAAAAAGVPAAAPPVATARAPRPPDDDMNGSRLSQSAYMTGKAVIDGEGDDAGDGRGKGSATFLQADGRTVCYGFNVTSTGIPNAIAIYKGAAGSNGPAVVKFANVPKDANGQPAGDPGWSSGCKAVTDPGERAALRRIRKNPQNYYLMMKTQDFPAGAIRGQLSKLWYSND